MDRTRGACLHTALRNGSSMEYLERLIARYPQSLTARSSSNNNNNNDDDDDSFSCAAAHGYYPLHTALVVAESADEAYDLVDLILRHDPVAAQRWTMDGSLPLHVAAAAATAATAAADHHHHDDNDHDGRPRRGRHRQRGRRFFLAATERILEAYPRALEVSLFGADGMMTPLAVAIGCDNAAAVQLFVTTANHPAQQYAHRRWCASPSLLTRCLTRRRRRRRPPLYDDEPLRRRRQQQQQPTGWIGMDDRAKLTIVQCLLAANPRLVATKDPNTNLYPLHRALVTHQGVDLVRYLLAGFPGALQLPDDHGRFPIHLAVASGCSTGADGSGSDEDRGCCPVQVVTALLDFDPSLIHQQTTTNAGGDTDDGSSTECYTALALALNVVKRPPLVHLTPKIMVPTSAPLQSCHENNRLAVIALLIGKDPEALWRPFADDGTLLLHRCVSHDYYNCRGSSSSSFWPAVVSLVLNACPAAARRGDVHGRLPLHTLVRHSGGDLKGSASTRHDHHTTTPSTTSRLIRILLDAYPAAITTPDSRGQLPIHTCLATFRLGHDPYDGLVHTVALLGRYRPSTLLMADHDGYLPLHLACQQATAQHLDRRRGSMLRCVELLVQLCPQAAATGVSSVSDPHDNTDGGGRNMMMMIPLVVAATNDASLDVVFFLARRSPDLLCTVAAVARRTGRTTSLSTTQ